VIGGEVVEGEGGKGGGKERGKGEGGGKWHLGRCLGLWVVHHLGCVVSCKPAGAVCDARHPPHLHVQVGLGQVWISPTVVRQ
jgi:hypothetical protein